jgi:hypothetical protein
VTDKIDRVVVPASEVVPGDWVVYFSQARPAGTVTRKVVGKTRESANGQWMVRVAWGSDKTEAIPVSRIKCCLRDAEVQQRISAARAKEVDFRSALLAGLGVQRKS